MRSRAVRVVAIATFGWALVLVSGLTTAEATRTVYVSSKISIKSKGLAFSGRVSSKNAGCQIGRRVTLYRKPSRKLGSVDTTFSGSWKIVVQGSAGISLAHFYAKVSRRSDGAAGTIHVCKAATSKTIRLKP
jgi:hypothetical protein